MSTCHICAQILGDAGNDLISQLLDDSSFSYVRRIPIENDDFAVIPSLGPLVPGHILLCPKGHVKSIALIDVSFWPNFDEFKCLVKDTLKLTYDKEIHFFEHGNAQNSATPLCTVEHAHLHAFPASRINFANHTDHRIPWIRIDPGIENFSYLVNKREYLYYESPDGEAYVAVTENLLLGSQYFRKVVAKVLGHYELWNWKKRQAASETDIIFRRLADLNLSRKFII